MSQVQVGDIVKSLDFAGNSSYFMIGEVTDIVGEIIKCRTIKQVCSGARRVDNVSPVFETAMEGCMFMDDKFPGRVTVIG